MPTPKAKHVQLEAELDDLFPAAPPPSAPPDPPTLPAPAACTLCGNATLAHPRQPPICALCTREAPARLDALELAVVEAEERLAAASWRFDAVLSRASAADQARYDRVCAERLAAIGDRARWDKVQHWIAKALARRDGLSRVLQADAEYAAVGAQLSDQLARLQDQQLALLGFAPDWIIPDAATARRAQLDGQRRAVPPTLLESA